MNKDSKIRVILKHITFMKIAQKIGDLSYDEKHQVGAILVKNDFSDIKSFIIHSIGYNGNYSGGKNERDSLEHGKSGYLHAEENMLIKSSLTKEVIGEYYTAFVTMTPCYMCSKRIVNSGVKNVIYLDEYINCGDSKDVFDSVNVKNNTLENTIINLLKDTNFYLDLCDKLKETKSNIYLSKLLTDLLDVHIKQVFQTNKKHLKKYEEKSIILFGENEDEIKELYLSKIYEILMDIL